MIAYDFQAFLFNPIIDEYVLLSYNYNLYDKQFNHGLYVTIIDTQRYKIVSRYFVNIYFGSELLIFNFIWFFGINLHHKWTKTLIRYILWPRSDERVGQLKGIWEISTLKNLLV